MSVEEYLAYDRTSEVKHEYIGGDVVAMAGGTAAHNRLTLNMAMLLIEQLGQSGPCRVYASDVRVYVANDRYFYPDVVVSCDVADHHDENDILYSPHLVVEVLSRSTEGKDRGEKLASYKRCPEVQEYVLVNTRVRRVEVYRCQEDDTWQYQKYGADQEVVCESLDLQIPLAALYAGVRIPIEAMDE